MDVVVLGAGYAGTIAANTVARKLRSARVTVVNPRALFVERVRLHQELAGSGEAATPLSAMLRDGITTVVGEALRIGDGTVALTDGTELDFDALFVAVGSTVAPLPGTVPVGTWEGAEVARRAFAALPRGSDVTVVGGGLTGIETAAELAESRPSLRVRLVAPVLGAGLSDRSVQRARSGLTRLGVTVVEDTVASVGADKITLRSGARLASDLTLWAVVSGTSDLAARSGLAVDADGRARVDEHLRSVDDDRIFVVGDCAAVPGARLACATATPQGAHAARTFVRLSRGRTPKPYSMGYVGQALSLGRKDAVVQLVHRDDTPRRLHLAGRPATWLKESACRYARIGARSTVYTWLRGPR